jgi:multidrug efflux pump subunit AcrA (membrane-fusion protein)
MTMKIYPNWFPYYFLAAWLIFAPPGFSQNKKAPQEPKTEKSAGSAPSEFVIVEEVIAIDPGRMDEVRVKPGDIVKKGDKLGNLDYRRQWYALEVAKVRANDKSKIKELEAEVSLNTSILNQHREGLRRRQFSNHHVAQSEARLGGSQAKLDSAKANQQLQEIALAEAQRAYDDRFFFSPINGVVLTVEKKKNENVAASNVVFTIGDNSSWVLRREVSPETAASLFVGRSLPFFSAGSDVARIGRVTNIVPQDNGQHVVEMTVPNSTPITETAPPQFEEPKFLPQNTPP